MIRLPSSGVRPQSSAVRRPSSRSLVIAAGRLEATIAFEPNVVDFFVSAAELLSVPKSLTAIYGIVFASPAPLSFADIEARLDLSKDSLSQQGLNHVDQSQYPSSRS